MALPSSFTSCLLALSSITKRQLWGITILSIGCSMGVSLGQSIAQASEGVPSPEQRKAIVQQLLTESQEFGRAERGEHVFANAKAACASCHRIGEAGGKIGPELVSALSIRSASHIVESLLWPNLEMESSYQPHQFLLDDDTILSGYLVPPAVAATPSSTLPPTASPDGALQVRNPATGVVTEISEDEIVDRNTSSSLMPSGLLESLPLQQQWDLIQFLVGLPGLAPERIATIENRVRNASHHGVLAFEYDASPLNPQVRPYHDAFVNRDRIYDFYGKQANAYRGVDTGLEHLASVKSLDDGKYGHWGNQDEETWKGIGWSQMQFHVAHATVFAHDTWVIPRGVCLKLGPENEHFACYDPEQGQMVALWQGEFLKFSSIRHGLLDAARMAGEPLEVPEVWKGRNKAIAQALADAPNAKARYLGYVEIDGRIEFRYRIGSQIYTDSFSVQGTDYARHGTLAQTATPIKTSRARWPERLETAITIGEGDGYVIDTIELPTETPWNSQFLVSSHGFSKDGAAIVATIHGDVYRVENVSFQPEHTKNPPRAQWKKIASGLHHPLGIWIDEDGLFVQCRNQLTRLQDLDGDHEIDYYECVSQAFITSPGGHDYICGLVRDSLGNFYTASGNQGVVKISPDGEQATVVATGFRNPDGIGIMPGNHITVPTSEGDWTPSSMVHWIAAESSEQTTAPPHFGYGGPRKETQVELPFLCLPRYIDNSSGGQIWVSDPRMGPLHNQMVHTSFGTGTALLMLKDEVQGIRQGAVIVLPGDYQSGIHRGAINPVDGQLYFSGMAGWGTYTPKLGCFERLRYTGAQVCLPTSFHIRTNGVELRFSAPISPDFAGDAQKQFAQAWNYRYAPAYGSPEYSVTDSATVGHDRLRIESVVLDADHHGLFLEIPELQRCNQLHLNLILNGEDSVAADPLDIFITVNALDDARQDVPSGRAVARKTMLPHPLVRDIARLENQIVNPWKGSRDGARSVRVEAADNLQFVQKSLSAKSGEWISLTFANPDVVPHNWALFRPGSLERIGEAVNKLIADPDAYMRQYVPESSDVVCYTDIVAPKSEFTITFQVPEEPGRYPYLCTFPGHWMVMNGELVVEP